jgi:hypothetical protein
VQLLLVLADPGTWSGPEHTNSTDTTRYGTAQASAWHRCHPRLEHRGPWRDHPGPLPIIEGTLIRLRVGHLPGDRAPKTAVAVDQRPDRGRHRPRQAFLRRFDLEHTFGTTGCADAAATRNDSPPDAADS